MSIYSARQLLQRLFEQNLITEEQQQKYLSQNLETDQDIENMLKLEAKISEEEIVKAKSHITGVPFINPVEIQVNHEVIKTIPEAMARKYGIFPVAKDANYLTIAMVNPNELEVIEYLQQSTGLRVRPNYSTPELIKLATDKEYSKSLGENVNVAIEQAAESTATRMQETLKNIEQAEDIIKVSPVAQIVSVLLEYAVKSGASDIHIEPFENGTRIRYRIDGDLQEKFPLPKTIHNSVVARIKILANMQIDEHRKPLDGKFKVIFGETKTDLRVSTIPAIYGEKVVIRLLKDQRDTFTYKELGMWGNGLRLFEKATRETTGIILVTGPTGSGKTVTNATALAKLNTTKVNIITLEDPVEIQIPGVNQVQINPVAGLTFANGLRAILRQDPNIIMVGEIRDSETAQLAIQSALTGHLVLATLHTNSAPGAIPRLIDMGVENFLLASTINIAIAQRLARKICTYCKEEYEALPEMVDDIKSVLGENLMQIGLGANPFVEHQETGNPDQNNIINQQVPQLQGVQNKVAGNPTAPSSPMKFKLYRGKGCEKCNGTGYKGRLGLFEMMDINEQIGQLTLRKSSEEQIRKEAINNGMITLVQDGYLKAMWGITTLEEVISVADI